MTRNDYYRRQYEEEDTEDFEGGDIAYVSEYESSSSEKFPASGSIVGGRPERSKKGGYSHRKEEIQPESMNGPRHEKRNKRDSQAKPDKPQVRRKHNSRNVRTHPSEIASGRNEWPDEDYEYSGNAHGPSHTAKLKSPARPRRTDSRPTNGKGKAVETNFSMRRDPQYIANYASILDASNRTNNAHTMRGDHFQRHTSVVPLDNGAQQQSWQYPSPPESSISYSTPQTTVAGQPSYNSNHYQRDNLYLRNTAAVSADPSMQPPNPFLLGKYPNVPLAPVNVPSRYGEKLQWLNPSYVTKGDHIIVKFPQPEEARHPDLGLIDAMMWRQGRFKRLQDNKKLYNLEIWEKPELEKVKEICGWQVWNQAWGCTENVLPFYLSLEESQARKG